MVFKFRLQKVLDYRSDKKKLAEEELAKRRRELLNIEQEMERLWGEKQKLLAFQQVKQSQQLDIGMLRSIESYYLFLKENFQQKRQEYLLSQEQVEEKRQVLVERWRSCRVLERLKEKAFHSCTEEEKKREQDLNDEISLAIYNGRLFKQRGGE